MIQLDRQIRLCDYFMGMGAYVIETLLRVSFHAAVPLPRLFRGSRSHCGPMRWIVTALDSFAEAYRPAGHAPRASLVGLEPTTPALFKGLLLYQLSYNGCGTPHD